MNDHSNRLKEVSVFGVYESMEPVGRRLEEEKQSLRLVGNSLGIE